MMKNYQPNEELILKDQIDFFSKMPIDYARNHGLGIPNKRVSQAKKRLKELINERR